MKICHFTSAHKSNDIRIFHKECSSLAKAGYEVYLVAQGESREENGVHVVGCGNPKGRFERMFLFSKTIYKKAESLDCDIYHFHDPELLVYAKKLKKMGKIVVFDSHEDVPRQILAKTYIPAALRKIVSKVFEKYELYVCKQIDGIVTVIEHIKNVFIQADIKNVAVVKNFPSREDVIATKESEKENAVCYVGGISPERGISDIVKAMNSVDSKLYIAGSASDSYKEQLIKLNSAENVEFTGFLSKSDVEKLYSKCKVGLCVLHPTPNHINSLAIKIFEYMSCGIPVVCSNFPIWKGIIEKYDCGICVEPQNIEEISDSINFLLNNPKKAKEMGENGRRAVEEFLNWETQEKILFDFYGLVGR